jgi:tRNA-dihydrouridine synthase
MVGRAVIGNAFFFKQANALLHKKEVSQKKFNDFKEEGQKFIQLIEKFNLGPNDARPYFIGLAKGLVGASFLRNKFGLAKSVDEMKLIFENHFQN